MASRILWVIIRAESFSSVTIRYGNRLIMLHAGRIILDISGQEKKDLTVPELLEMFARASGDEFSGDRAILA